MSVKQHQEFVQDNLDTQEQALKEVLSMAGLVDLPDLTSDDLLQSPNHESLYAIWAARLFSRPIFFRRMTKKRHRFGAIDLNILANIFGLEQSDDIEESDEQRFIYFKHAQALKVKLEPLNPGFNGLLNTNLDQLANLIGLSQLDKTLLGFFCLLSNNPDFIEFTGAAGELNRQDLQQALSVMLNVSTQDVSIALSRDSKLFRTGLLKLDQSNNGEIQRKVDLLSGLTDVLMSESNDPLELLEQYFFRTKKAELSLENYPHLEQDAQALITYLTNQKGMAGVNILIHGEPGTGKTQWVKTLAEHLNSSLYEVSAEDEDGDPLIRDRRVSVYRLAQSALAHQGQSLVLFDEVEDVFPSEPSFFMSARGRGSNSKAWINKLLEENPVPTFWISNKIHHIDPAYIRRFDMVIEVSTPPKSVRRHIIESALEGLNVRAKWIDQLSGERQLVPAVIERSAKVVRTIQGHATGPHLVEKQVLGFVNKTLQAQGKRPIKLKSTQSEMTYSLDYVNVDADIHKLVDGVKASQTGRFCLYGLPGTGKTAFGHHLAEALEKPLILKRASDLLSPYVGEAEQNIAAAFEEAIREDAVLQIDEADSFLRSREKARQSWEVTQVNELLTQMESFEGIFIASTNLMDDLDQAAMRRFDLKLEFKPLTADQAWSLFNMVLEEPVLTVREAKEYKSRLAQLSLLTPGDFAVVLRKLVISGGSLEPEAALVELAKENAFKPKRLKQSGMGFLAPVKD
ncbi:MAG: AAA family ATPase [Methyloprofundus sp.]|nr:AAA family ATPase [Methyloprofundus sp.]